MKLCFLHSHNHQIAVQLKDDEGVTLKHLGFAFTKPQHYSQAALELGVERAFLETAVNAHRDAHSEKNDPGWEVEIPKPEGAFRIKMRGRLQTDAEAKVFTGASAVEALKEVLAVGDFPAPEPVFYWEGDDVLCLVDVDFHSGRASGGIDLLAQRIEPRPIVSWTTHGGGLRLVYDNRLGGVDSFTASELAGVAAVGCKFAEPNAAVELKTITRHPSYRRGSQFCGPVRWHEPSSDVSLVARWLGGRDADAEQVSSWLEERGLVVGQRYAHSHCPHNPGLTMGNDPVCVREGGIKCYSCEAQGLRRGSREPGWFPFASLTGEAAASNFRLCAKNMTHWSHAKHVVEDTVRFTGKLAESVYAAAMKMLATKEQPRSRTDIARAFASGRDLVRLQGNFWSTEHGETYTKDITPILAAVPAGRSEGKADLEKVCRLTQAIDLTPYGYPPLRPIWGMRVFSEKLSLSDPTSVPVVMQQPILKHDALAAHRPRYLPLAQRPFSEDDAWKELERVFPGLYRDAVRLYVAARGCFEGRIGMPPFVFVTGPTSSAKSSTVTIAGAICGDSAKTLTWQASDERNYQQVAAAAETGSFAVFDEIMKTGRQLGRADSSTLDFILKITPGMYRHKLFVGPVPLEQVPVCVFTDTEIPLVIRQDSQLCRRLVHLPMPRQVDWVGSMADYGVGKGERLRLASENLAQACNVVVSCVIDDFFGSHAMSFTEIASKIGLLTLDQSEIMKELEDVLLSLFDAVCRAPALSGADARRWGGRGWKVVVRGGGDLLSDIWAQVADPEFTTSRKCSERSWGKILGCGGDVQLETRAHGSRVALRFVARESRETYRVNEELGRGVPVPVVGGAVVATDFSWMKGVEL